MRTMNRKGVIIVLLLAALVLLAANQAIALVGSNTGGGAPLLDPYLCQSNMSGTKVSGTVTLSWHDRGTIGDCATPGKTGEQYEVSYIFRVNSAVWPNWQYKGYSGTSYICADEVYNLEESILGFLGGNPQGNIISDVVPGATWAGCLKSYSNYMDSDTAGAAANGMSWIMFDFVTTAK